MSPQPFAEMKDIMSNMGTTVDGYEVGNEVTFDPERVESYKQGLCEYMDSYLSKEMERVSATVLGRVYEDTQKDLIGQ